MVKKAFAILVSLLFCPSVFSDTLIDYGAGWKYFLGTTEASSPNPAGWRLPGFDDGAWSSGPSPIGYANPPNNAAEDSLVTLLPTAQQGGYLSVFLRHNFSIQNPQGVSQMTLNVNVDDGFIAWINGQEVGRYNMADGEPAYNSTAISPIEPTLVSIVLSNNPAQYLIAGNNTLAIQLFNANATSSDLVFDLAFASDADTTAPTVVQTSPTPGATVPELSSIEIVFSESVTNVDAADLLINNTPANRVLEVSPRDYVFSFSQAASGTVNVAWSSGQNITDLGNSPNHFGGGQWSYTLDTNVVSAPPIISEFLADNNTGIRDEDADRSDWIELYNPGLLPVNLEGWFLTDSALNPGKWRIPAVSLDPNKYLLIWASGKNRTNPATALHTNFKLSKDGSYLALLDSSSNVVFAYSPAYPPQRGDVSYGADASSPSLQGYYQKPTPGAANSTSGSGFAGEPIFSKLGGVYTNNSLQITLTAPSGQIRYTIDGSVPTASSTLYSTPLSLTTSTTVKARVFDNGVLPSSVIVQSYFFIDSTVANFTSELPVMIFSTSGKSIQQNVSPGVPRTFAAMTALDTFRGKSSTLGNPDYFGQCELEVRGQTSSGFPKLPYNVELQDAYRNDRNSSLLGLPAGSDWDLNNPYSDKPFLQNFMAFELHEKMGHYAVRRRFVEVFMNTGGGRINYARDYAGIYLLQEKIKIDNNRVEIKKLTPNDNTLPNISGGYIFKKDKDSAGDLNFSTQGGAGFSGQNLKIHDPKAREITSAQLSWLTDYLNRMERSLYASNWKTATGTNHYSAYLDVDSFVDYHWIVEFAKQIDGYRLSNYMQKDRDGKVKMEPIWDWNLSFGNADYATGFDTTGWYYSVIGENDHIWLRRLICGSTSANGTSGDPDFNQRIADRWSQLRTNILNPTNVLARIDQMAALLNNAATRDFNRYPRLGTYVWPNPDFYVTPTTYGGIIAAMKNWIQGRYNWIDSQFIQAPRFGTPPGRVPAGINVALQGTGSIYYTVDGSDPRLSGGGLSPQAITYTGPINISSNTRIFARIRNGSKWSGPLADNFLVEKPSIKISEIMFHPAPPANGSPWAEDDFEYLEIENSGRGSVNLAGYKFTRGLNFTFPPYDLAAGAKALLVRNRAAFESRYGTALPIIGEYAESLDNGGERLTLLGSLGETVADFSYQDNWYPITDGSGFALVQAPDAENLSERESWRAGYSPLGTPGTDEPFPPLLPQVVISELLPRSNGAIPPGVELQNLSSAPVDVGGWFLTDNFQKPKKYRIPQGTQIQPGGFLVINISELTNAATALDPFTFNQLGEEVYLFSGNQATNLTGYVHGFEFGPQYPNVSFGRVRDSAGQEHFVAQSAITLGSSNAVPAVGPIVISEIMYHPQDVFANGTNWNNTESEYIELQNISGNAVDLFDSANTTNTWRVAGSVDYQFPQGISIPAGAYVVLVSFDPLQNSGQLAAFRAKYSVPGGTLIAGPYKSELPNSEGKIRLLAPGVPIEQGQDAGTVPYIEQESVEYSDSLPWNAGADGIGFSLSRSDVTSFGGDPAKWIATFPSPGAANFTNDRPEILSQPMGRLALQSQSISLSVTASGAPLFYQWRVDGKDIPGATSSNLTLANLQPSQSGDYSVIIYNAYTAVASIPARVVVGIDQDNDGMDDQWELNYGLNPFRAEDAVVDSDNDGFSNFAEYLAGTDPSNSNSYFVLNQNQNGAATELSFQAKANRTYTIQYSNSLEPVEWQDLMNVGNAAQDRTISIPKSEISGRRFFRVVTPAK